MLTVDCDLSYNYRWFYVVTQPFILTGSINRVPTSLVGVKAGRSPLLTDFSNCVYTYFFEHVNHDQLIDWLLQLCIHVLLRACKSRSVDKCHVLSLGKLIPYTPISLDGITLPYITLCCEWPCYHCYRWLNCICVCKRYCFKTALTW